MKNASKTLLEELERLASERFDGHLTIMRSTTNWRVGFGTPRDRFDIEGYPEGATFDEAAMAAIWPFASRRWKRMMACRARREEAGATPREQSTEQLRPWDDDGISRRTWYRRRSP